MGVCRMSYIARVEVMLSSYNGEAYIREQVESILRQKGCDVHIVVRDDGSEDATVQIIKELQLEYRNKIVLYIGKNIGYRKSFLKLLAYAGEADYFAFSDQDDIWMEDKLIRAIDSLKGHEDAWLYSSALTITDERLNVLGVKKQNDVLQTVESFFIRTRLAGCTFVFKPELMNIAIKFSDVNLPNEQMPDHDFLICVLTKLYDKDIHIDGDSYIFHRRVDNSMTAGKSIRKRVSVEMRRIFKRKHCYKNTAALILETLDDIPESNRNFLQIAKNYNQTIGNTFLLLKDRNFTSGMMTCDVLIKLKIILRIY